MRILTAQLTDFRNIEAAELTLCPRLNVLIGPNGQGKTNVVEALYAVAALRPLRSVTRGQLIRTGCDAARVAMQVEAERTGLTHDLAVALKKSSRVLSKDGKTASASAFIGVLTAVAFTPDDLDVSKGPPDGRRKFIDRAILNTRPAYLDVALRYARALKSRNRLLVDEADDSVLDAYDETLALAGAEVSIARARYLEELNPRIVEYFQRIADPAPPLELSYRCSIREVLDADSVDSTARGFAARLADRRRRDRLRRTTGLGPHLDDLDFQLEGQPARARASQGQHRALVLAIKLAEIVHLTEVLGEPPVLLLDDISSELDAERSRQLFEVLAALDAQVVLTTTDEAQLEQSALAQLGPTVTFDVSAGSLLARAPQA